MAFILLVLNEMVLVLEKMYWESGNTRAKMRVFIGILERELAPQ